ncbi:MAG: OFA family MFS transporter [Verrucomicrobiota bacterium]|jgi:OFA family oxalate/formate antiporter-like MFS transporter
MNEKTSPANKGWTVVIAGLAINLILGVLYAWGVIAKALGTNWHWTKTQATLPFTVATVCFAGMMVFAGRCQDKFGPRLVATAGGIMLGLGLLASALVHSPTAMMLTFGVGAGLGIGLGYSATTPPAIKWFPPARKGVITGIVVSGVGLAAVYISPLSQYLLGITTIPWTFAWLGIGTLVLVPLLAQLLRNPPEQPVAPPSTTQTPAAPRRESDWPEMLRTGQFYQLWLLMVLSASAGMMIITQVAMIAKEQANWSWGFVPIATLAIFNTLGRLLSGALSDKIGRTRTMTLAFLLQAVNMIAFSHYDTRELVVFGSAFTGLCYGTIFTLMPAATADFYGIRNLGVNYGLVFTAFGIAGVVGPLLGAGINDHFKSYFYAYQISAAMLVMGAVLAMLTKPPRTRAMPVSPQPDVPLVNPVQQPKPNPIP